MTVKTGLPYNNASKFNFFDFIKTFEIHVLFGQVIYSGEWSDNTYHFVHLYEIFNALKEKVSL